ncbi:hypothetical protein D0Y65_018036 [Glycine soja]|uniref:Uncharacterized protein n=1 Tax=Glycine soja TaxID=3848 RepID=A0A445JXJ0_GLYSO|nr:hypothetical protein D0Y65_018036 [Glycine soja]
MMLRMMQVVMKNQNKAKKSSSKPKSNIAIKELNVASKNLMDPIPEDIMVNVVEMEIKTVGNVDPPSKPPTELDEVARESNTAVYTTTPDHNIQSTAQGMIQTFRTSEHLHRMMGSDDCSPDWRV